MGPACTATHAFAPMCSGGRVAAILAALTLLGGCAPTVPSVVSSEVTRAPFFLLCGALGESCCRPPGSPTVPGVGQVVACQAGLGCDIIANKCVSPCGGTGQVCCDGPETRATKWTSDGKLYSPDRWNMREMCDAGACDAASHRCFACGTQDGAACCPPVAAQATARCVGERLHCEFTPGGFATSGVCRACGIQGREPCPWGCDDALGIRSGLCAVCGGQNQPPCDNGCNTGLGVAQGLCRACGNQGQMPCDSGCRAGLGVINNVCTPCGKAGQPQCPKTGCGPGTRDVNGVCTACGAAGQTPCASGCSYPLHVAAGVCQQCGAQGQIPCDVTGCNAGLVIFNNRCQPQTTPLPGCSTLGQGCVADFVSGTHCCQTGGPLLCVYGQCRACVPHGQECTPGGSQTCCNAKDGDVCRLDTDSGKATCGLPG